MKLSFGPLKNISLKKQLHGFTLPEMLVTLAVVVILISMTAPSMQGLIINQRVTSATQEIFTSIHLARSEAIKQQRTVSLCSTINGLNCDDATGWEQGWLIFTDADADGILEDGDRILRISEALNESISLSWNQGGSVSFNSRGQADVAGTFEVCADGEARAVIISRAGRPRVEDREVCS